MAVKVPSRAEGKELASGSSEFLDFRDTGLMIAVGDQDKPQTRTGASRKPAAPREPVKPTRKKKGDGR
jgi:hypothetical protein